MEKYTEKQTHQGSIYALSFRKQSRRTGNGKRNETTIRPPLPLGTVTSYPDVFPESVIPLISRNLILRYIKLNNN
jgi:hypothetical protein